MAKLFFGLNLSLDGYVDHQEFAPGPALFRHFVEQVHGLAEASGPHDFAVRLSVHSSAAPKASIASRAQRSVTIAKRPSYRARDGEACRNDLPDGQSEKFFAEELDNKFADLPVGQISKMTTGQ